MSLLFRLTRLWIVPAFGLCLVSCETTNTDVEDPYASNYGSDGRYNPYPGQSGYAQSSSGNYQAPAYETPPAPAEPDAYAFDAPTPPPKPASSPKTAASKPKSTTTARKSTGSSGGSYTVVKGDTLYAIARKKGSTVAKIKSANGLSSDLIRIGQTLKIP